MAHSRSELHLYSGQWIWLGNYWKCPKR